MSAASHEGGLVGDEQGTPCNRDDLMRVLDKKSHPLNPDFLMKGVRNTYFRKHGHNPSAGLAAVLIMLYKCTHVHLYGFNVAKGDPSPLFLPSASAV